MHQDTDAPSKSQVKREMQALRDLGRQLTELPLQQRADLPLSTALQQALVEYDRLRAREARRRHLSYVGKLLRREDLDAIREGLARFDAASAAHARQLHLLEAWRDAIIEDDAAMAAFVAAIPEVDRPKLRQLARRCRQDIEHGSRRHYRSLFHCLRDAVALHGDAPPSPPRND